MNDDTSIPLYAPAEESSNRCRVFARYLACRPGPNLWESRQRSDYGPEHDFELEKHVSYDNDVASINHCIITPVSEAAKQWLFCHLPEHAPRYGAFGFIVEARYLEQIVNHMKRDKLMTPECYNQAMEENHALMLQGEER